MSETARSYPLHAAALTLLLLTGCRSSEITGLTWGEVRSGRIYLDDSKTGARLVYLCSHARAILSGLARGKAFDFVFRQPNGKPVYLGTYWLRIKKLAELGNLRLHDIRHSYASLAARRSLSLPTIQRLLGHARIDSTARYTHFDDGHLHSVAQQISDLIERSMEGGLGF